MKVTTPAQRTDSKNARLWRMDLDFVIVFIGSFPFISFHFRFFISEPGSVPRERTDYEDVRRADALVPVKLVTPFLTNFHGDFASASSDLLGCRRTTVPVASLSVLIRITWLDRLCGAYAQR
jgi:hypothetical protein